MTAASKKLNLFDFTMIMVSLVIGMGIFRTPVNVAKASPDSFLFFAAWIAGGLVALCGALTYAEIGSRFLSCDVKGLNSDVLLKIHISGESFRGFFFVFEDLRQSFLGLWQIVVGFQDADSRVHKLA